MQVVKKITFHVDFTELERAIKKHYGVDYPIPAAEEAGNDQSLSFSVSDRFYSSYEEDTLKLLGGEFVPYRTGMWLDMLCQDGYIEPGEYIVNISW